MAFYCDLCHKELDSSIAEKWGAFFFGVVCEDHNHEDIGKVVELTAAKVRADLIEELTKNFREDVIKRLENEQ